MWNVGKKHTTISQRDDDVMGSHASLWLWNRATWEKLNSPRKEEKDFPDPSWMEKEENKWDG